MKAGKSSTPVVVVLAYFVLTGVIVAVGIRHSGDTALGLTVRDSISQTFGMNPKVLIWSISMMALTASYIIPATIMNKNRKRYKSRLVTIGQFSLAAVIVSGLIYAGL
jgi:hypothetical protein